MCCVSGMESVVTTVVTMFHHGTVVNLKNENEMKFVKMSFNTFYYAQ
jgi:hypothetical protein